MRLRIYHHTGDQGFAALASLRHKYQYRTSALSEKHRQLIRELLAYRIVSDVCSGSRDWGRKLRRETSLAGDVPAPDESVIQPPESKKQKTRAMENPLPIPRLAVTTRSTESLDRLQLEASFDTDVASLKPSQHHMGDHVRLNCLHEQPVCARDLPPRDSSV